MALYTGVYEALKTADATNAAAVIAASAQAMQWDPAGLARLCALIGANPSEVAQIIATARASADNGAPWFAQP